MTGAGTAFERALDQLGHEIVAGTTPAGHTDTIAGLVQRTGASRSVVREVTRVLGALGMLSAGRRVGLMVMPPEDWNVLDPRLIRWRLDGPSSAQQVRELRALRHAVEPAAAAAAAAAMNAGDSFEDPGGPHDECGRVESLRHAATALSAAATDPDPEAFLAADQAFHNAVLELSGNTMLIRLRHVIEEGLRHRAQSERGAQLPDPHDVDLHEQVADAIGGGDAERAASRMREIIQRTSPPHS